MSITKLHILLADDDTDDCIFFKEALDGMPLSTAFRAVHDGEQLMQLLYRETGQLPDVLFLDLNMPGKNGFECLAGIKQHEKLKALPVIIFSTLYEAEMVNQLYKGGAAYFIRKPAVFELFKKLIFDALTLISKDLLNGHKITGREDFVLTGENMMAI